MSAIWKARQQNLADKWNAAHGKAEVAVHFWPGSREASPKLGTTRPFGAVLNDDIAVVYVYGAGAIALTHVMARS